ncbi:glycoside hydrolase family 10 protein [Larkinella knui]|uniref:Glycoside hydrolase n=1 Tax=Larkinella knui TaxID=2025310 RepID=A0A3P1CC21_9BACT|nr:family 10 glycosylhydrolase [Larkinella knui]RRB10780.1 glycoside hydrolase [Larkinella knui]
MRFHSPAFFVFFVCFFWKLSDASAQNPPKREFRAVWIATVDNIDWPSVRGMPADSQRAEFIAMLDQHQRAGINAVVVQIRAAADAFYAKSTEPWSFWLTGQQGRAPVPFYDPLEFMIRETHDRGMEFHAWFNLDRATYSKNSTVTSDHISLRKPEWMLQYGGRKLFNLGLPEVRNYVTSIVTNIVRNYDVDGIHFDDYFYPYGIAGQVIRDEVTYKTYFNGMNLANWRRENINQLILQLRDSIRALKPYVKFGVSPFGVWKNRSQDPEGSQTTGGLTSYFDLYADTRKWIREGWIDYIAPQVYFSTDFQKVPYRLLVDWWIKNGFNRHLYIGQGAFRINRSTPRDRAWNNPEETPTQLRYNRQFPQIHGSIFFSSRSLTDNLNGVRDSLLTDFYRYPALIPPMPWKDPEPPLSPKDLKATPTPEGVELFWQEPGPAPDGDKARYYVVYRFEKKEKINTEDPTRILAICVGERTTHFIDRTAGSDKRYVYVVTSFDRLHNESAPNQVNVRVPEQ